MERTVYCNKCGSEDVVIEHLNKPEPERVSMDDLSTNDTSLTYIPAVYWYQQYRATCADCGYFVEYKV